MTQVLRVIVVSTLVAAAAWAAPVLRLSTAAVGPVNVTIGAAGAAQTVEAFNAGDGTLALTVSASEPWLVPATGAARACTSRTGTCIPVNIALQTASLAKGVYTGFVTIGDANAVDAPQSISVTIQVGGGFPDQVDLYAAPNAANITRTYVAASPVNIAAATQSGGGWLGMTLEGSGSWQFNVPYRLTVRPQGLAQGTYRGTVQVTGSSFAQENKTMNVTLNVTSQPIANPSASKLDYTIPEGSGPQSAWIAVSNAGMGNLNVTGVTATMTSGADWLKAAVVDGAVKVEAERGSLGAGRYEGSISIASNAVNSPHVIPVTLRVVPVSLPQISYRGVVNNATFRSGETLAPGSIVALFGSQLTTGEPAAATSVPLPTELGDPKVRVLVNGNPAPLYYSSAGQINFQMPFDLNPGEAVIQVERGGQLGNRMAVTIGTTEPRILRFGIGEYGIVSNNDGTFALPPNISAVPGRATTPGAAIVIYAIGLGRTSPAVATGAGAPSAEPLARPTAPYRVRFGPGFAAIVAEPFYVGLTGGFVGLYQVNVFVPAGTPKGAEIPLALETGGVIGNTVHIAVQ